MRRYRTVIIIALLGIVPMIGAVFVMRFILPDAEPVQTQAAVPAQQVAPAPVVEEKPDEVMVLAAARALAVGTLLADEHLTEAGIEEELVRRRHIETEDLDQDELPHGYVVREAIAAGAPVTWTSLVGPRQRGFLAAVLRPGMRALTVKLGAGTRHSGLVDPGDRVDVVLTAHSRERDRQNVLARTILEDVRVVAVDRRIGSGAGSAEGGGEVERKEIVTATLEVFALADRASGARRARRRALACGPSSCGLRGAGRCARRGRHAESSGAAAGEPSAEDCKGRARQRGQRGDVRERGDASFPQRGGGRRPSRIGRSNHRRTIAAGVAWPVPVPTPEEP